PCYTPHVYTHPVVAAVGHTEQSARMAGIDPQVATASIGDTVRARWELRGGGSDGRRGRRRRVGTTGEGFPGSSRAAAARGAGRTRAGLLRLHQCARGPEVRPRGAG